MQVESKHQQVLNEPDLQLYTKGITQAFGLDGVNTYELVEIADGISEAGEGNKGQLILNRMTGLAKKIAIRESFGDKKGKNKADAGSLHGQMWRLWEQYFDWLDNDAIILPNGQIREIDFSVFDKGGDQPSNTPENREQLAKAGTAFLISAQRLPKRIRDVVTLLTVASVTLASCDTGPNVPSPTTTLVPKVTGGPQEAETQSRFINVYRMNGAGGPEVVDLNGISLTPDASQMVIGATNASREIGRTLENQLLVGVSQDPGLDTVISTTFIDPEAKSATVTVFDKLGNPISVGRGWLTEEGKLESQLFGKDALQVTTPDELVVEDAGKLFKIKPGEPGKGKRFVVSFVGQNRLLAKEVWGEVTQELDIETSEWKAVENLVAPTPTETPLPTDTPTSSPTPIPTSTFTPIPPPPTFTPLPPPTETPPPVEVPPLIAGQIPTLDQISKCANGVFPEAPGIPERSHNSGWSFGLIVSKEGASVKVQQIYDGSIITDDLSDVARFEFRQVIDRARYGEGYTNSFQHVIMRSGEPYTIQDVFPHLSLGTHVWIFPEPGVGKVLFMYCDASS